MSPKETSTVVVGQIVADITDRRGLRQAWESVDGEIQEDIKDTWADLIATAFQVGEPLAEGDIEIEVVDPARPSRERAAWLLNPVSSIGRETIQVSQYEELRAEAVALRKELREK